MSRQRRQSTVLELSGRPKHAALYFDSVVPLYQDPELIPDDVRIKLTPGCLLTQAGELIEDYQRLLLESLLGGLGITLTRPDEKSRKITAFAEAYAQSIRRLIDGCGLHGSPMLGLPSPQSPPEDSEDACFLTLAIEFRTSNARELPIYGA